MLRVVTTDQDERQVLDFWRCAMLPLRDPDAETRRADDLDAFPAELDDEALAIAVASWRLDAYRAAVPGRHFADLEPESAWAKPNVVFA